MDHGEWYGVERIYLDQFRDKEAMLVNVVVNLLFP
jgi:prolipoprotein diacylglyceryltransferase